MLPLKVQIDPFLDDIGTRAETMLRWKHVFARRRLMQPLKQWEEGQQREIYQATFYPKPGDPQSPRRRRGPDVKP